MATQTLTTFLRAHLNKNKKDADRITHTRIPDETNNIKGGSYIIEGADEIILHDLIYNECILGSKMEYLTEVRRGATGTMAVDLDFRYSNEISSRQHTDETIKLLVFNYLELIKTYLHVDATPFHIFIMEKPTVNKLADKTKDGIHMVFGINVPFKIQIEIRKQMLESAEVKEALGALPLTNKLDEVFDKGISTGKTNWQLLGCRKPCHDQYRVVSVLNAQIDPLDNEWMVKDANEESNIITRELYTEASVRSNKPSFQPTDLGHQIMNPETVINKPKAVILGGDTAEDIVELMRLLNVERCQSGNYEKWRNVGMVVKNTLGEAGRPIFDEWTKLFASSQRYSELDSQWDHWSSEGSLRIGSLHMWAREDSPVEYRIKFPVQNKVLLENNTEDAFRYAIKMQTHDSYAKLYVEMYKGLYKCVDIAKKLYYEFSDTKALWIKNESGSNIRLVIGNEFKQKFDQHVLNVMDELNRTDDEDSRTVLLEELDALATITKSLETVGQKNNILSAVSDIICEPDFLRNMNKQENYLPIKGKKMLNMTTLECVERDQSFKFDYECDATYRKLTADEEDDIRAYFESLFCGKKDTTQVVLNILKSAFTGKTLRYIFFVTGSGRNGKSVLFNILRSIFGRAMDVISNDVIIQKKSNSHLNTEVEKLDLCRLGYITELKETDKLNETLIKKITGGDPINLRTIQKTDATIIPTTNLFVPTNELPSFDVEQAIVDRIINIPFNNRFEVDAEFEKKMIAKREQVFCYIMKYGVIQDVFEQTEEMKASKQEYVENNVKDYLGDFINDKCEKDGFYNRDDFRDAYNEWCKQKGYKKDSSTDTAFTRKMKQRGIDSKRSNSIVKYVGIMPRIPKPELIQHLDAEDDGFSE